MIKSVLGRVGNCVGTLCYEMVVSSYVNQPNHSYADFKICFVYLKHATVVAGVLHSVWSELPHQGSVPYRIIHRLVATQFS